MAAPNDDAPILVIGVDHLEHIGDNLSLRDVVSLGRTCKLLKNVVGQYIRLTYRSSDVLLAGTNMIMHNIDVTDFLKFIRKITIWIASPTTCHFVASNNFESLRQIDFYYATITTNTAMAMGNVLANVVVLKLHYCNVQFMFDNLLQQCGKIRHLHIEQRLVKNSIIGVNNDWMLRHYPLLSQFGLELPRIANESAHLNQFLTMNPNIKRIHVNSEVLLANRNDFIGKAFDELRINCSYNDIQAVLDILEEVDTRRMHRKLALILEWTVLDDDMINKMALFTNLVELHVNDTSQILDPILLARKLVNLERASFNFAFNEDLVPLIRNSVNLKRLSIKYMSGALWNLTPLNAERKNAGACKVTIFVEEMIYLTALNSNIPTTYDAIEVKREGSQAE